MYQPDRGLKLSKKRRAQLDSIRKRLEGHKKDRKTVPYPYYPGEIPTVAKFERNAEKDIEFLLNLVELLARRIEEHLEYDRLEAQ